MRVRGRFGRDALRNIGIASLCAVLSSCAACDPRVIHPEAMRHHDAALQYLAEGQCVQAEERCRLALEYGRNFEHPHNCLGMIELACRNDLDRAAKFFRRALSVNPDFAEAHNNLGVTFFRRNPPEYGPACDEYLAAIEIDPAYEDARENYGTCLMRHGTILGAQGDLERRKELYRDARSQLVRLSELNPYNAAARHHLGYMDMVDGDFPAAERHFQRCLEVEPDNALCAFNLGRTQLLTSRCEDAIQSFITVLRVPDIDVGPEARSMLGDAYEACAKRDGAIKAFLDKIKSDPGNPGHHFDLGNIYAEKGLYDQAENEWLNTVKLDPMFCSAYHRLAMSANKTLDTQGTIDRCRDFIACAGELQRSEGSVRWVNEVAECKTLVSELEVK